MQKIIVTGAAGFIGSTVVDRLLVDGCSVTGIDNFSTGQREFLKKANNSDGFSLIETDILTDNNLVRHFYGADAVFHFSANADVRDGVNDTQRDLEQNTIVTSRVLEACKNAGVKKFLFSSTGSIYGETEIIPTPEDVSFPVQTSLYGASKLACEGMIQAYSEAFGIESFIFRFVSILGPRYTHGHVYDFIKQLLIDNSRLQVLGDGKQRKSYLHVEDCVDAMLFALSHSHEKINIYNLGTNEYFEVIQSIECICAELGVNPTLSFEGGRRGWIGDNPFIYLDTAKIQKLGWSPKYSIRDSVKSTTKYLLENKWLFGQRV